MQPLRRFWRSLETIVGCATVDAQWREFLGREYKLTRRFFLPSGELATFYPHPDPGICVYQVTRGPGEGEYVAVCEQTAEWLVLTADDLVLWELDRTALGRALAVAFKLQFGEEPHDHLPDVCRIGYYAPLAGYNLPAFLAISSPNRNFPQVVNWLVAMHDTPMLLLVPTRRFLSGWQEEFLRRQKVCLIPLEETVEMNERGRFSFTPGARRIMREFRRSIVPDVKEGDRVAFFPTPPNSTWSDVRIRLVDGHTAAVAVGAEHGVLSYVEMGMVNRKSGAPSVQWELLRAFATNHGTLTWRSRQADRRNQKRRELLGRQLREFFRIEGDPFVPFENGWQARFAITDDD